MEITITIKIDDHELLNSKDENRKVVKKGCSQYARFFDSTNMAWNQNNNEFNLMFLKQQELYANELLKHNGYLFLNDVYGMLYLPKSKVGQIVGWVYDENNPSVVDFGIYNDHNHNTDFINGNGDHALLDFNVDGNVLSLI